MNIKELFEKHPTPWNITPGKYYVWDKNDNIIVRLDTRDQLAQWEGICAIINLFPELVEALRESTGEMVSRLRCVCTAKERCSMCDQIVANMDLLTKLEANKE